MLSELVRKARSRVDLTRREAARLAGGGWTAAGIAQVEAGDVVELPWRMLEALASVLALDPPTLRPFSVEAGQWRMKPSAVGAMLRRRRQAAGLTRRQVAAAAGVSVDAVKRWESGDTRCPRVSTWPALIRAVPGLSWADFQVGSTVSELVAGCAAAAGLAREDVAAAAGLPVRALASPEALPREHWATVAAVVPGLTVEAIERAHLTEAHGPNVAGLESALAAAAALRDALHAPAWVEVSPDRTGRLRAALGGVLCG